VATVAIGTAEIGLNATMEIETAVTEIAILTIVVTDIRVTDIRVTDIRVTAIVDKVLTVIIGIMIDRTDRVAKHSASVVIIALCGEITPVIVTGITDTAHLTAPILG